MDVHPQPLVQDGIVSWLQDLVLETYDAEEFFQELAVFSASLLAPPGGELYCNLTVVRRKKPIIVSCS